MCEAVSCQIVERIRHTALDVSHNRGMVRRSIPGHDVRECAGLAFHDNGPGIANQEDASISTQRRAKDFANDTFLSLVCIFER